MLQLVGAVLILAGFALVQAGRLHPERAPYLVINALGAGILAVLALLGRQWGFVLLEGSWTLVSLVGLARLISSRGAGNGDAGPTGPAPTS